jgi:hypothetical protein
LIFASSIDAQPFFGGFAWILEDLLDLPRRARESAIILWPVSVTKVFPGVGRMRSASPGGTPTPTMNPLTYYQRTGGCLSFYIPHLLVSQFSFPPLFPPISSLIIPLLLLIFPLLLSSPLLLFSSSPFLFVIFSSSPPYLSTPFLLISSSPLLLFSSLSSALLLLISPLLFSSFPSLLFTSPFLSYI